MFMGVDLLGAHRCVPPPGGYWARLVDDGTCQTDS